MLFIKNLPYNYVDSTGLSLFGPGVVHERAVFSILQNKVCETHKYKFNIMLSKRLLQLLRCCDIFLVQEMMKQ